MESESLRKEAADLRFSNGFLSGEIATARDRIEALQGDGRQAVDALEMAWGRIDELSAAGHVASVETREAKHAVSELRKVQNRLESELQEQIGRSDELERRDNETRTVLAEVSARNEKITLQLTEVRGRLEDEIRRADEAERALRRSEDGASESKSRIALLEWEDEDNYQIIADMDKLSYHLTAEIDALRERIEYEAHQAVMAVNAVATAAAHQREESLYELYGQMTERYDALAADAVRAVNAVSDASNAKRREDETSRSRWKRVFSDQLMKAKAEV